MTDVLTSPVAAPVARRAVSLLGIGTAVPRPVSLAEAIGIAQRFACETPGQRAWLERVFSRAGVRTRGSVLMGPEGRGMADLDAFYVSSGEQNDRGPSTAARMARYAIEAPALAERAARAALADAARRGGAGKSGRVETRAITHLITASCTGFYAPGLDVAMIQRLGLSPAVQRLHVGFMGCHAGFNALAAARDIVLAHPEARVLVCCVELSTLHFAYGWAPEKLVANALFADGASACVVGAVDEVGVDGPALRPRLNGGEDRGEDGAEDGGARWRHVRSASLLLPASADAMTWHIGDHGFEMTLSAELPALIKTHLRPWAEGWLAEAGLSIEEVAHWAIHPGGPKIIEAAAESLGLSPEDTAVSYDVLARQGNMSSATVLFLLEELGRRGAGPGYCVAIGFGPGLMAEGMLLER